MIRSSTCADARHGGTHRGDTTSNRRGDHQWPQDHRFLRRHRQRPRRARPRARCFAGAAPNSRSPTSATPSEPGASARRSRSSRPSSSSRRRASRSAPRDAPPRHRPRLDRRGARRARGARGRRLVVFGSEYRTAPGAVVPGTSARWLSERRHARRRDRPRGAALARRGARSRDRRPRRGRRRRCRGDRPQPRSRARRRGERARTRTRRPAGRRLARRERPRAASSSAPTAEYAIETASSPVLAVPRGAAGELRGRLARLASIRAPASPHPRRGERAVAAGPQPWPSARRRSASACIDAGSSGSTLTTGKRAGIGGRWAVADLDDDRRRRSRGDLGEQAPGDVLGRALGAVRPLAVSEVRWSKLGALEDPQGAVAGRPVAIAKPRGRTLSPGLDYGASQPLLREVERPGPVHAALDSTWYGMIRRAVRFGQPRGPPPDCYQDPGARPRGNGPDAGPEPGRARRFVPGLDRMANQRPSTFDSWLKAKDRLAPTVARCKAAGRP